MNVSGKHVFKIDVDTLWSYLMDHEVLAKITPGVTKLEVLGEDSYKSISDIKIGPVKGSFSGKLYVVDKIQPDSFAIKMEQLSKIGNAHATVNMHLSSVDSNSTELSFSGKANLSGVIARTGQRVLTGVANSITKEVFKSLEEHIEEQKKSGNLIPSHGAMENQSSEPLDVEPEIAEDSQTEVLEQIEPDTNVRVTEPVFEPNREVPSRSSPLNEEPALSFFERLVKFFKNLFN